MCLMFSPLHALWEGDYKGEKILQEIKPYVNSLHGNWAFFESKIMFPMIVMQCATPPSVLQSHARVGKGDRSLSGNN